ncbi:hypothetical protein TanjilG_16212 [Lupinus angustifolius]|uniref:Uncharacterized protein n=1 Tax=Lupinus angustifolius TaxID=3871 RepID=A0A1J7GAR2_LUPAN|nr:PREDICTED: uncharacterized protein LOC109327435 [Lupinus angustifolius]OIV97451.1 hypothetical protein TanjilG_16212 [Lupinus angustifolius]
MPSDDTNHFSAEKSFRIKQNDRFFTRLMAKEISNANTSSRVLYYGETSLAVPFIWEAQPGTPKHPLSQTSLPPLTPPPSYYSNSKSISKSRRNYSKVNIIFSRFLQSFGGGFRKKDHVAPSSISSTWSPSSSLSTSTSSWSLAYSSSSPSFFMREKDYGDGEGNHSFSSSRSHLKHKCSNGFRGCYPFGNMKNATISY